MRKKLLKRAIHIVLICTLIFSALPTFAAAKADALRQGDSGDGVSIMQAALKKEGFYTYATITGFFGDHTLEAVKAFQKNKGLTADGVAGAVTLRALLGSKVTQEILDDAVSSSNADDGKGEDDDDQKNPSDKQEYATLRKGDESKEVENLQKRLSSLGYFASDQKCTGLYGDITVEAVEKFQAGNSLLIDGVAGNKTQTCLYSGDALPYEKVKDKVKKALESKEDRKKSSGAVADQVCEFAQKQLGKPYIYANEGPNSFDCSGLVIYVMKEFGITGLGRSAKDMGYGFDSSERLKRSELKKGDLVFFNTVKDNDLSDHAGIYLGDGKFIHCSSSKKKVIITDIDSNYWKEAFSWGARVL